MADLRKNINPTLSLGRLSLPSPAVMGVLNVTPDSFSDGGRFNGFDKARRQAERMAIAGAAIIDVGGESTRPGSSDVSDAQELDRVVPIIEAIRESSEIPVSIDTSKASVMRAAVAAGASMVNDVLALQGPGSLAAVVDLSVPVCLMHMRGRPRTMQIEPHYDNVAEDVTAFLRKRVAECRDAGIGQDMIVVDPGFGFGKTHAHNVELLANLRQLERIGVPILVGLSRKSTLGEITGRDVEQRLPASLSAAVIAAMQGAQIIRAHDVQETVDAMRVVSAVMEANR